MKKIITTALFILSSFIILSNNLNGIKIYINPGHGGWDANDRNVETIPFAMGDTLGFYESKSNLIKGLYLRDLLQQSGATVFMSRTLNRSVDDRSLSEIAEEANANNVDAFLSIHSNAIGTNAGTNFLLLLYHGPDNAPVVAQSLPMCVAAWPRLMSNKLTVWTHYTTSTNNRGDHSFYGNTSGLGVLRPLTVPGFLSEGSFHDYKPETHRLLNADYCKLEAVNFHRFYLDYYSAALPSTGIIAGWVKGAEQTINHAQFVYKAGTDDRWLPLNGATVKLMNAAGDSLNVYKVDSLYNGIFVFYDLAPGTYKLNYKAADHTSRDTTITVLAATTTYANVKLENPNIVIPKDDTPDFPNPTQDAGTAALNHYNFGTATVQTPDWLTNTNIKRVLYRNEKYYVLTRDPKIMVINATTNAKISEMKLDNISGGTEIISDIAFTSDGYLLACNKDTISLPETKGRFFKVYTWDNDDASPSLLFQTQNQGNWLNSVIGETFTVAGPRWRCNIITPGVTTGTTKAIRLVGLTYEEGIAHIGYRYMIDANNYTEALWGRHIRFSASPTGRDHFYLDSEKVLATEYQFDWTKPDRDPLVNKGSFAEVSGFAINPTAHGNFYFRNASQVFMTAPMSKNDSTEVSVAMFNISNGLPQARKISDVLPANGLGTTKTPFMASAARVNGYDIDIMIMAENQGIARYRTIAPALKANVYASELRAAPSTGGYDLQFTLNDACDVVIEILDGENVVKTIQAGALAKGRRTVNIDLADLPEGELQWRVRASAHSIDRPMKVSNDTWVQLQYYSPRGVAVDNNIDSEFFGRVYASETVPGTVTNRATKDGIYILNAALEDVTNQGANSYAGGVTWGGASSPMRVSVGEDSKVYLTDWSDANPGVWVMNPANPTAAFTPVFSGLTVATGLASKNGVNVHGAISHCWATGKGDDTKLFTIDKYYVDAVATNRGNLLQYNIGTLQAPWQTPPSAIVFNDGLNGNLQQNYNNCIAPDGRGGWWISQHRAEDTAPIPSLIHVKPDGTVSFNSGRTPLLIGNSVMAGMAVNAEGDKLAMGCQNEVKVFAVTFDSNGVPTLSLLHSIKPAMGTNTVGLSYDRAGNLYVISNSSERLGVWAMPKTNNSFVTPSPATQKIVVIRSGIDNNKALEMQVKVYPNPARDYINIEAAGFNIQSVELLSLDGRLIKKLDTAIQQVQFDLSGINKGIYLLKINAAGKTKMERIVVR